MSQREEIKLFEATMVRTFWEDNEEKWYFCINDVVGILTESVDPADYFKTLRKRDSELDEFVRGSNCPPPPTNLFRRMEKNMQQGYRLCRTDKYHLQGVGT